MRGFSPLLQPCYFEHSSKLGRVVFKERAKTAPQDKTSRFELRGAPGVSARRTTSREAIGG